MCQLRVGLKTFRVEIECSSKCQVKMRWASRKDASSMNVMAALRTIAALCGVVWLCLPRYSIDIRWFEPGLSILPKLVLSYTERSLDSVGI